MVYTIVDPDGAVKCHSGIPYCGYSYDTLQSMASNGYTLQIDGKKGKFPTKTELAEAKAAYQAAKNKRV